MVVTLYWISDANPSRLAILPRPRGGDWLEDEIQSLHDQDVGILVSLLTDEEVEELELAKEPDYCNENGIAFRSFPIPDRDIPASYDDVRVFVEGLSKELLEGKAVAIHCRAGIGRSSLVAACTLVVMGLSANRAFELIRKARGCNVPDTDLQRVWVERFAQWPRTTAPAK